jgi:hypothetical protein
VHGAGADRLRVGADRHGNSECTGVECDLVMNELHSVAALVVSSVLRL